jgi:hypothetical protein
MLEYAVSMTFIRAGCVRLKREHPRRHQRSIRECRRYGSKVLTFLSSLLVRQRLRFPLVIAFCLDMKQTKQFEDTKSFLRS